jgi:hypothetical protein
MDTYGEDLTLPQLEKASSEELSWNYSDGAPVD